MRPHAFIAMPFGRKPSQERAEVLIDFDAIWQRLLAPALEAAGCEPMRADQESQAGDIRTDMFQELLSADLVLVDLTVNNPNVWYELGVRHALRKRGVVLVYGVLAGAPGAPRPFDVYTDRKLAYALDEAGRLPEGERLAASVAALAAMVRATLESSTRRVVSPVYKLLPHLEQPQWKQLLMSTDNEVSEAYRSWTERVKVARRAQRPGDILTLAEETPVRALAHEALREAGSSLLSLRQAGLALEQFDRALEMDPQDSLSRQRRAIGLCRLGRFDEARALLEALLEDDPRNAETLVLLGRVDKEKWIGRWRRVLQRPDGLRDAPADPLRDTGPAALVAAPASRLEKMAASLKDNLKENLLPSGLEDSAVADALAEQVAQRESESGAVVLPQPVRDKRRQARDEDALLAAAIRTYRAAFLLDPRHCYAGVNALMLTRLRQELGGPVDAGEVALLAGGVRWAVDSALAANPKDYWALETRAELSLLLESRPEVQEVCAHWARALAAADQSWYSLDASRQVLEMLADLGFQPRATEAALALVEREIRLLDEPFKPRQVLLFSGHRMDEPGRSPSRFTPEMEAPARQRLDQVLAALEAGSRDLAICQAAAGADLLFLEACRARQVRCLVMLPFDEPEFVRRSVLDCRDGEGWRRRWLALREAARVDEPAVLCLAPPDFRMRLRVMPERLGPLPRGASPFERCNRWMLNTALSFGPQRLRLVTLWDGQPSARLGGTAHLAGLARQRTVHEHWIDTRTLASAALGQPGPEA